MMKKIFSKVSGKVSGPIAKVKADCGEAKRILSNTNGLEAFEIAIGVGIAVVLGVIVLGKNKDLFANTIWPKVTSNASSIFS